MKKFFALFCALTLVLGISASPKKDAQIRFDARQGKQMRAAIGERADKKYAPQVNLVQYGQKNFMKVVKRNVPEAVKELISIDFEEPMSYHFYSYQNDWWMRATNDDYTFSLDVVGKSTNSPAGSYDQDDILYNYCYLIDAAAETRIYFDTTQVVEINITDDEGNIEVEASFTGDDGNEYMITMFYAAPTADNFETINATNLRVTSESYYGYDGYYTYYYLKADDDNNTISLSLDGALSEGTYSVGENRDITGSVTPVGGQASSIYSGSITVELSGDGGYHVTGTVLCYNNTEYTLDLIFIMPDASRTETLSMSTNLYDQTAFYGWFQFYGFNADRSRYITVCVNADVLAGTFGYSDLDLDYTFIALLSSTDTLYYSPLSANLNVSVAANGDVTLTGVMRMQNEEDNSDVVDFDITLTYVKPVASRTGSFSGALQFYDSYYYSIWQAYGYNTAGDKYISIAMYYDDVIAGTYTADDIYSQDYTYLVEINGNDTVWLSIVEADLTVMVDANNNGTITGTITVQNEDDLTDVAEYTVNITFTASDSSSSALQYDSDSDFAYDFPTYTIDTKYVNQYGVIIVSAEDGNKGVDLQFNVANTATGLAVGTYPIDDTDDAGTLHACTGYNSTYDYIDYTLAYTFTDDGYFEALWYMVSGSAVVKNDGTIAINAVNSLGYSVVVNLLLDVTALDDVKADNAVVKELRQNGQIVIRANGKEYNVLGVEL